MKGRIQRRTLRSQVYEELRHRLLYGDFVPGQYVKLRQLEEQLGVSMIPIREALWQLSSEKLIVMDRNRSIRVNSLTVEEMREMIRVRVLLESEAMSRACELRPESAVSEVGRLLERVSNATGRLKVYTARNADFHFAIYRYAGSPLLVELIERVWARVAPYFIIYNINEENLKRTNPIHEAIFKSFADRDKPGIVEAITEDITNAGRLIVEELNAQPTACAQAAHSPDRQGT